MTNQIVRAAIHPGIGIARMGNSESFYVGPKVMTPGARPPGSYHDQGLLKREAAEFRIYGYDGDGNVVAELTPDNAEIDWTVHLAARKASWYKFRAAMDLPAAADFSLQRRNPDYPVDQRDDLTIDPGPRRITGKSAGGDAASKFVGTFRYKTDEVNPFIGELRTDEDGHLLVLSGLGVSGSPAGLPIYEPSETDAFGNATGWYDEACDGPITATVKVNGQTIPCEGAWIAVGPPNYAPDILGWRTLLDLLEELWQDAGWMTAPTEVSFTRDIYPILGRLSGLQWVNRGFAAYFGPGGPLDFNDPTLIDKLARIHGPDDSFKPLRREIFNAFRPLTGDGVSLRSQPWIYGDAFGTFPTSNPANGLALWEAAARRMQAWVVGNFVADWGQTAPDPTELSDVPLTDQPRMLDRAALHFCVAEAFHPGIELTWPVRHLSIWEKPFRIRARPAGEAEPDYGDMLTTQRALGPDGPLNAQGPGGLTRWMALPWQADTAGCRSGYVRAYDPNLPTFWPARVPNHVLTEDDYAILMDSSQSEDTRRAAFHRRASWYAPLAKYGSDEMTSMVSHFGEMGVVERRDGPADLPGIPQMPYVSAEGSAMLLGATPTADLAMLEGVPQGPGDSPEDAAAIEAGWQNDAQRRFFEAARMAHTLAGTHEP